MQKHDEKPGPPIVAGRSYDEDDDWCDAVLKGIVSGIEQRKAAEAEAADKKAGK